ncbi:hypothetical protein OOZ19_10005 [Saccharopolyspora sp. NFXS83]|uniref:hypothetical protein n=1 Tax=Saccharopolyspora sp. NFXS83 TaxID=2993560 RepID=UPI00224ACEB5|nr:hypothetical protein [Saccharopolyspora sp. NFXS83]MCX2730574.1 hypothetical protein [Saccharopolyspora sp. NFXS83]
MDDRLRATRARSSTPRPAARPTRYIARTLSDDAWQITDGEGQHTARLSGTEHDAVTRAHRQLAAFGGGTVLVTSLD